MFLRKCIQNNCIRRTNILICPTHNLSSSIDIEKLERESNDMLVIDEEAKQRDEEIERKRNKSRLRPQHRNVLLNKPPYEEPNHWSHGTLKYQRKLYGKYGQASQVDPSICWPTKAELADRLEYERVKFDYTIPETVAKFKELELEKQKKTQHRQQDIAKKLLKLDVWTKDLKDRIAKKEAEIKAAKDRKDKLVEEVRRHFGYTVDPRDEKFKEMLEKKEKEQKKAIKEARKKAKEEKMITKLQQLSAEEMAKLNDKNSEAEKQS